MAAITALLHTHDDALRLGRCLETLYPCDDIVVVDYGSADETIQIAREYGARIVRAKADTKQVLPALPYAALAAPGWILALDPHESLSEALAASLYELKSGKIDWGSRTLSVFLREETSAGWILHPKPQTRVVASSWTDWQGTLPARDSPAPPLEGEVLRFVFP